MRAGIVHRNNRGAERGVASLACVSSDEGCVILPLSPPERSVLEQNIPEKIGLMRVDIKSLIVYVCA